MKMSDEQHNDFKQAVFDAVTEWLRFNTKSEDIDISEAIHSGVYSAIWQIATNVTSTPCQDFYETIGKAAEKAFGNISIDITTKE